MAIYIFIQSKEYKTLRFSSKRFCDFQHCIRFEFKEDVTEVQTNVLHQSFQVLQFQTFKRNWIIDITQFHGQEMSLPVIP